MDKVASQSSCSARRGIADYLSYLYIRFSHRLNHNVSQMHFVFSSHCSELMCAWIAIHRSRILWSAARFARRADGCPNVFSAIRHIFNLNFWSRKKGINKCGHQLRNDINEVKMNIECLSNIAIRTMAIRTIATR